MNICLIVLIGIPGVGKTHLCEFIIKKMQSPVNIFYHISYDDCEADLSANIYKNFRKNVYEHVKNLVQSIVELKQNKNQYFILIDDNMYYRSMRRVYYNLARDFQISYCQIFVTCSLELALERNNNRNVNRIPCSVINAMYEKLEIPSLNNHWELYSVTINSQDAFTLNQIEIINKLLADSLLNPVLKHEPVISYNHASFIHTIDLNLRKIVNSLLQKHATINKDTLPLVSQEYSVKKKFILSGLKNGDLYLPEFKNDEFLYKFLLDMMCTIH